MTLEVQNADGSIVPAEPGWTVLYLEYRAEARLFRKQDEEALLVRLRKDAPFAQRIVVESRLVVEFLREYAGLTLSELVSRDYDAGTAIYRVVTVDGRTPMTPTQLHDLFHNPNDRSIETTYRDDNGSGD